MKDYFKHFKFLYIVFGIIFIIFVGFTIKKNIPDNFLHKETLYELETTDIKKEMETEADNSKTELYFGGGALVMAGISTAVYANLTKPKKEKYTVTEKTFLGYRNMRDSRDILIRK